MQRREFKQFFPIALNFPYTNKKEPIKGVSVMTIIIDGYNLLKQREPREFIGEDQRNRLIKMAKAYGVKRGHSLIIIFDGGPLPNPFREVYDGVVVMYAGWQLTADDIIKEYIEEHSTIDGLLVSSDSQLCSFASRYEVPSIDALAFWEIMEDTLKKEPKEGAIMLTDVVKTTGRENKMVDDLMLMASQSVPDKDRGVQRAKSRLREQHKGSKAERMLKKKLSRL